MSVRLGFVGCSTWELGASKASERSAGSSRTFRSAVSSFVAGAKNGLFKRGKRIEGAFFNEEVVFPPKALFAGVWLSSRSCCEAAISSILGAEESIGLVRAIHSITVTTV
jgi:hypothetical protein